jgi:hypothetical protein
MPKSDIREAVLRDLVLREPLFSSQETGKQIGASAVSISKALGRLARHGLVTKVMRGLWANTSHPLFSPYLVVGRLETSWGEPTYVSFISALHLHGILSQIPREMHIATARLRPPLKTPVGTYIFHQLKLALLTGFEPGDVWGRFQRASPEKALFDTAYVSLHRGQQWRHLPELELPPGWDWDAWSPWIAAIDFAPFREAMEQLREGFALKLRPREPAPRMRAR